MAPGNIILDIILLGQGCRLPALYGAGKPGVSGYTCPKNGYTSPGNIIHLPEKQVRQGCCYLQVVSEISTFTCRRYH